jgi:hypothetical protein
MVFALYVHIGIAIEKMEKRFCTIWIAGNFLGLEPMGDWSTLGTNKIWNGLQFGDWSELHLTVPPTTH